jgi:hypothetical protein
MLSGAELSRQKESTRLSPKDMKNGAERTWYSAPESHYGLMQSRLGNMVTIAMYLKMEKKDNS